MAGYVQRKSGSADIMGVTRTSNGTTHFNSCDYDVELTADARTAEATAETELGTLIPGAKFGETAYDIAHTCWFKRGSEAWHYQFSMREE